VRVDEPAEVDLVRRAQRGEAEAFADLVRRYQRQAVSLAYRLLGNAEDAKDVGQDAFVRAYQRLSQLEDASRFAPWLMRVVSNLALNFRRARRLRLAAPLEDGMAGPTAKTPGSGRRISVLIEDQDGPLSDELQNAITAALEELPDKQRLALILFSVEGMAQKDVAEVLECSVELVKWNVFQARKKLKELLQEFL